MTFQLKSQVTHMYWLTEVFCVTVVYRQDNHHLLKSLAACNKKHTKLKMYFTINLAFTNYLNKMSNLMEHPPIDRSITEYEQTLPIHLNVF